MQVSVENTSDLGRRLKVAIPADQIDDRVVQRIRELGRNAKLKGFRPGKVPFKVLQQRYGEQVRQDVVNDVLRESFQAAVEQEKLRPAGTPELTAKGRDSGQNLEYTAEFDVYPQMETLDVSGLNIERPSAEVGDQDVDNMIETLRQQRREWEPVERGAQDGDLVVIEYHAEADGSRYPEEGEERAGTVLGSNSLLPGLEERLVGREKGDSETVELPLPDDFSEQDMAGKPASIDFKVLSVAEAGLPELDEAFIQSFGVASGDPEEFRREVRNNLERELHQAVLEKLRRQVVDELLAAHQQLELPESLIEQEAENLRRRAAEADGRGEAKGAPSSAYRDQARRRVAAGFLLSEAARQNQIQADPGRIRQKIAEIAATYEQPQEVLEAYQNNRELLEGVQGMVLEEQVVDWIVQHANVTDKATSFDSLLRSGASAEVKA